MAESESKLISLKDLVKNLDRKYEFFSFFRGLEMCPTFFEKFSDFYQGLIGHLLILSKFSKSNQINEKFKRKLGQLIKMDENPVFEKIEVEIKLEELFFGLYSIGSEIKPYFIVLRYLFELEPGPTAKEIIDKMDNIQKSKIQFVIEDLQLADTMLFELALDYFRSILKDIKLKDIKELLAFVSDDEFQYVSERNRIKLKELNSDLNLEELKLDFSDFYDGFDF